MKYYPLVFKTRDEALTFNTISVQRTHVIAVAIIRGRFSLFIKYHCIHVHSKECNFCSRESHVFKADIFKVSVYQTNIKSIQWQTVWGTCREKHFFKIENSAYIFEYHCTWASLILLASDYYNKYSQGSRLFQMLALDTLLSPEGKELRMLYTHGN